MTPEAYRRFIVAATLIALVLLILLVFVLHADAHGTGPVYVSQMRVRDVHCWLGRCCGTLAANPRQVASLTYCAPWFAPLHDGDTVTVEWTR